MAIVSLLYLLGVVHATDEISQLHPAAPSSSSYYDYDQEVGQQPDINILNEQSCAGAIPLGTAPSLLPHVDDDVELELLVLEPSSSDHGILPNNMPVPVLDVVEAAVEYDEDNPDGETSNDTTASSPTKQQPHTNDNGHGHNEDDNRSHQNQNQQQHSLKSSSSSKPFFAWSLDEDSLMHALFPDLARLQAAWEVHPLLSKVSFNTRQDQEARPRPTPLNSIPTIFHNRSSLLNNNWSSRLRSNNPNDDPILSLFEPNNALQVLEHINSRHGKQYKVVKKVIQDGQEYMGQLPESTYSVSEIASRYFKDEGMSLVINDIERRWSSIAKFAYSIMEEVDSIDVNANLYMTPEVDLSDVVGVEENGVVRQGFDVHWDTTDVVIVQVAGRKRWSVANSPIVHLSNIDMKRKPTQEEIEFYYASRENSFREFTLCPGDVLYIPRGHMHNASTVVFEDMKRQWADWDACPDYYPTETEEGSLEVASSQMMANTNAPLADRIRSPSLHLTFGILTDLTVESLIHYSIYDYFEDNSSTSGILIHEKNRVQIPARTCSSSSPDEKAMNYDVTMQKVLHHSLAEVARRKNDCDNVSFTKIPQQRRSSNASKRCEDNDAAILRQLLPLIALTNNDFNNENTLNMKERVNKRIRTANLKKSYERALEAFGSLANVPKTIDLIQSHILKLCDCKHLAFDYPGYAKAKDAILCPSALHNMSEAEFERIVRDFVRFGKGNFDRAYTRVHIEGKKIRHEDRQMQMSNLEKVGQG